MKALRLIAISGLLAGATAYAHADAHWTAGIGTGHAADGVVSTLSGDPVPAGTSAQPARPFWGARIGTGRVSDSTSRVVDESPVSTGSVTNVSVPWSSKVGTGRVSDADRQG